MSQAQEVANKLKNFGNQTIADAKKNAPKEEVKEEVKVEVKAPVTEEKKDVVVEVKEETKKEEPKAEEKREEVKPEVKAEIDWDNTEIPAEILERLAAKQGFKKNSDIPETDEEKQARIRRENGEFASWAITEGKLKAEDLALPQTIQNTNDLDLVKQDFANKLKANDKNISQASIDRLFAREYPLNAELPEDATAEQIVAFQEDKRDTQQKLTARAAKLRSKTVAPIQSAKQQFEAVKKNQQIISKADEQFNTFAKQFGKDFIYKNEDGDIPIELSTDFRKNFLNNLQQTARTLALSNPNGNLDVTKLANDLLVIANRKQIDGVLKSRYVNEGKAEALKTYKNPITETKDAGAPVTDKKVQADAANKQALGEIAKLRNRY